MQTLSTERFVIPNPGRNFFFLCVDQRHRQRKIFNKSLDLEKSLRERKKRMEDTHKPHRAPHSGTKADKKKAKKNGASVNRGNNPKAFTMSGSRKAEKIARRSTEAFIPPLIKGFVLTVWDV